tara:strand:+ start:69 stop:1193 length:1125 start_codon:yes stop_codon:yes gene_type:complete
MGYDNFQFGEKLNPDEFNDKFEKLFELVKKAYEHNNQLRNRLDVLNIAFKHANDTITNDSSPYANTDNYYRHEANDSGNNWQVVLGGQLFSESYTLSGVSKISDSNLDFDGTLMLSHTDSISRIPLVENSFGETAPSIGVDIVSSNNQVDQNKLWMLLSAEAVWAEHVNTVSTTPADNFIEFIANVPPTLSPKVNHIKATPIVGMEYQLAYDDPTGSYTDVAGQDPSTWKVGVTNALIAADKFANNLRLRIKGDDSNNTGGTVFAFGGIEAFYKTFATTGTAIIELDMEGSGERTLKDLTVTGQNADGIVLKIGNDQNFDSSTVIVYNSETAGLTQSGATMSLGSYNTLYIQVTLSKLDDTSPSISSIVLNYEG